MIIIIKDIVPVLVMIMIIAERERERERKRDITKVGNSRLYFHIRININKPIRSVIVIVIYFFIINKSFKD